MVAHPQRLRKQLRRPREGRELVSRHSIQRCRTAFPKGPKWPGGPIVRRRPINVCETHHNDEDELIAALALARTETTPCRDRVELVRRVGSCKKALHKLISRPDSLLERARRELDALHAKGFEALALTDTSYPRLLKMAPDPPLALTLWGQLATSDGLSLAIVGSRRATRYGLEMAARLAGELAWAGLTIVSGLARGIDGAAHRGALEKQGRTIAILGSGLSNILPERAPPARRANRGERRRPFGIRDGRAPPRSKLSAAQSDSYRDDAGHDRRRSRPQERVAHFRPTRSRTES